MATYPYCDGDRLRKPEFYMYSKFEGEAFFSAYTAVRHAAITELTARYQTSSESSSLKLNWPLLLACLPDVKVVPPGGARTSSPMASSPDDDTLFTEPALCALLNRLACHDRDARPVLDKFLKRFEVKKRLHVAYSANMQVVDARDVGVASYAMLGVACGLYHDLTGNLKYLNTALKLNDLLCSGTNRLLRRREELYLSLASLAIEREAVYRLACGKGVSLGE